MNVTRAEFVAEARSWLGTKYQHQGRLKGIACDCIGLVIGTAQALGLTDYEIFDYERRPDGRLRPVMEAQLEIVPMQDAQGADVILFQWAAVPIHVAILSDREHIIHSYMPNRKVVESRLDAAMRARVVAAYHVPGVV
jgi:NlpC/P60 family putative phage cell wall peptidase